MARNIDWDKPLSDEDRAWAIQRDSLRDLISENDAKFGRDERGFDRPARIAEIRSEMDRLSTELDRLEREQAEEDNTNSAIQGDPGTGNVIVDNTGVDGQQPTGAPSGPEDYSDTSKWTKAKLEAEIERRNEERKAEGIETLSTRGTRAELVERLMQDDSELVDSDEQ